MCNKIFTNRIFGKIVGEENPVFVAFNNAIVWPLLASFDGECGKKYILLEIGPYIKGFRYFYTDDGVCLEQDLSADEAKNIKLALGMIIASIFYTEGLSESVSALDYFTSVAFDVCEMTSSHKKNIDIVEEISKRSGMDTDEVTNLLLEFSNIPLDGNSNGEN